MKDEIITPQTVERYWKAQLRAVDRWQWLIEHKQPQPVIESAYEEVEQWTRLAEEVQGEYADQYQVNLSFDENRPKQDPQYCYHRNAIMTYHEADGTLYHCPDCGSTLALDQNSDWEIVNTEKEIPF